MSRLHTALSVLWMVTFVNVCLATEAHAYAHKAMPDGALVRWASNRIEMRVAAGFRAEFGDDAEAAAQMAAEAWRGFEGVPEIVIADGAANVFDENVRANGIHWVTPWPYAANQLALTFSECDEYGRIVRVDIAINGDKAMALLDESASEQPDVHDLAAVLTHEMGHVLGLDESAESPDATMWPSVLSGQVSTRSLTHDDEEGVISLYATPVPGPKGCAATVAPGGTSSSGAAWFAAALLAFVATRARGRLGR